ncbi:MAG: T9SS type A sorting domain-containing protein [Bacteroidales bacterium]
MKKILSIIGIAFMPLLMNSVFAQDTIVGWTFPPNLSNDSVANIAIPLNSARYLNCQYGTWGATSYHSIHSDTTLGYNPPNKCDMAAGWDNGADSSYWEMKFKTTGYDNLKLYSIQESDGTLPGPKYFTVQYKLPGANPWVTLVDTVTCANNWTTGVVGGVSIPATCDNLSGQVAIRWLLISNLDINGNTLLSTGINKIDNIVVTGTSDAGIETISENPVKIYPNPNNGNFFVENNGEINKIAIFDILGKCVYINENAIESRTNFSDFEKGVYLVQVTTKDNEILTHKIVVE